MSYSAIPNYKQPFTTKGTIERTWYLFLTDIWRGKPAAGVSSPSFSSSPFIYQAQEKGFMIVQGGTVTLIQFSRDGIANYNTGQTSGTIPLSQGDTLTIIYSVTPNITWVPL